MKTGASSRVSRPTVAPVKASAWKVRSAELSCGGEDGADEQADEQHDRHRLDADEHHGIEEDDAQAIRGLQPQRTTPTGASCAHRAAPAKPRAGAAVPKAVHDCGQPLKHRIILTFCRLGGERCVASQTGGTGRERASERVYSTRFQV